jgi:hypothetical protein
MVRNIKEHLRMWKKPSDRAALTIESDDRRRSTS